jgi:nicotinate-nucleotide adenylyltransferase
LRVGVYGGTFDPIHYGHLRIAEVVRESHQLEKVLFIPNQVSPFKVGETTTPGPIRAAMLERAIEGNPAFALWRGELEKPGPSYTVDTLRQLATELPSASFYFLLGLDAARDIPKWKEPEVLLTLARFVAVTRPGTTEAECRIAIPDGWEENIDFVSLPALDISSTELRSLARAGRSLRYLTPPAVIDEIDVRKLYRTG